MNPSVLFLIATMFPSTPAGYSNGWVIREEVRVERGGHVDEGWERIEVDADHVRRDTSNRPGFTVVDATDADHALRVLDGESAQSVSRAEIDLADAPGPMMDGIAVSAGGESVASSEPFRASGREGRIGSWNAREYVSTGTGLQGMRTTLWLADRPSGIPNDAVLSVLERVFSRKGSRWEPWFEAMVALQGFPVRRVLEYGSGGSATRVTITVTSIEAVPLAAARFATPAGASPAESRFFDGDER
jgi:hypothetical protein